jgi:double-stranded uracil-DNA glycosylase
VDRATVAVYERVAADYRARRAPRLRDEARAFGAGVPPGAWRADLGSGTGRYTPYLGAPVVALDAAGAMLALAETGHRVRADLEALPLRRGALSGAWANVSYQHVPRPRLPLALARLHDAMQVGAPLWVSMAVPSADDDFPGRLFERWDLAEACRLLTGAGFAVDRADVDGDSPRLGGVRLRTLPDIVGPGMRVLVCGLNPSLYSADRGLGFARPGNRFWPAALAAGLVTRDRDPWHALAAHGVGFTDLVKRATTRADELTADEYRDGVARVRWLVGLLRPAVVCMVGLTGWRAAVDRRAVAGPQAEGLGGVPVYVMPNTSGVNAHAQVADLAGHLAAAARLGDAG